MEKVAALSGNQRQELFTEAAARKGVNPAIIEKDFWVCWTLSRLFGDEDLSKLLMFKGGTSLSKVFHLIERFSEDIDLVLDWRVVAGEDPLAPRSGTKQDALNKEMDEKAMAYIGGIFTDMVVAAVAPICTCVPDGADRHVLNIRYPAAFPDIYLRPEVRLEIGPLASWFPFGNYQIQPYAAEEFAAVFEHPECTVQAIRAERTFWEKATILHHEANRPPGLSQPARYSRHYYDLAMMAASDVKGKALADLDQLADVVAFKQKFYRRGWAQYHLAKPGTLQLVPAPDVMAAVRRDYVDMRNMIFGKYPSFDEIMSALQALQDEINGAKS